ncbi:MAG: TRAP transporter small permease [Gammaproteobacteria bacterium]|nr:TRAP transporter small permease [Gammaproteobacteria bacterium]
MKRAVQGFERVLGTVDVVVRVIVVATLLSMTAVLFLNSIGRSVLNVSFVGGPALGRLLVIWLTFLGAYLAVRSGTHITVDIARRLVPQRLLSQLTVLVGLVSAVTCAWIAWLSAVFTWTRFAAGQIDPMLEIPSALFYLPVPIGAGLMTVAFLQVSMKALAGADQTDGAG